MSHGGGGGGGTLGIRGFSGDNGGGASASPVYFGRSSAAAFMSEVRGKMTKQRPPTEASPASATSHSQSRKAGKDMEDLVEQLILPPRRRADIYLEYYWNHIHLFNPILHRRTFQQRYEGIWGRNMPNISSPATPGLYIEDVDAVRAFYALFNVLIALGSLHTSQKAEDNNTAAKMTQGQVFFGRAEQLMSEPSMEHNHLLSVQAYILMAHYLLITGKANKCWVATGTGIRIAQGLGIHLNPPHESQAEQQERRRTWAFCIQTDR